MQATFILLPLISFDKTQTKRIKETYFSSLMFSDKLIRDWEEGGKSVSGICVVAKQIKIKSEFSITPETSQGEYWMFNMSKESLVEKLTKCGFGITE